MGMVTGTLEDQRSAIAPFSCRTNIPYATRDNEAITMEDVLHVRLESVLFPLGFLNGGRHCVRR